MKKHKHIPFLARSAAKVRSVSSTAELNFEFEMGIAGEASVT